MRGVLGGGNCLSKEKGTVLVLLASVFFGTEAIFAKLAFASGINFISTIAFRFLLSSIVLLSLLFFTGNRLSVPRSSYKIFGVLIIFFIILAACMYKALELLPASLTVLFFYSFPALTGLLDYIIKGEVLSKSKLLALFLSFLGLVFLLFSSVNTLPMLGVLFALGAAVANAFLMVLSPLALKKVNELNLTTWMFLGSAVFYLIVGALTGSLSYGLTLPGWLNLITLALISTAAANVALIYGLGIVGSTTAAIVQTIEPVVTAFLAFVVFRETLGNWQIFGAFLVLIGILIPHYEFRTISTQETIDVSK